jgi:peptide/nickel transport system substrate-binding protein
VARGPFAYPYIGGFATGSPYYDAASSDYHPFDQAKANALLDAVGATDTDGNGTRNLPGGGGDIMIPVMVVAERSTDTKQLEAVTSQLAEVGIGVIAVPLDETTNDSNYTGGQFTATLRRENVILPTRETCRSWPASDSCPYFNAGGDRLDFETELANKLSMLQASSDAAEQAALARDMQRLVTENAYAIGTIQIPAALLVNKRIKNAHPGTPVFMYEWAEDGVIRERLWTAKTDQVQEVLPGTIAEY